jgi:hypothetical protein
MKTILLAIIVLSSGLPKVFDTPSDYERSLSNIAGQFRASIMDKDECENKMRDLSRLIDDIENDLDKDEEFSPDDITQLGQIKKKAEALKQYIGAVGHCGNTFPTIDQFNTANRMVGGDVAVVSQGKYCIDIITVTIDKYKVYLAQNNTYSNYTVSYQWKSPDGQSNGKGSMGLASKCVRPFYDNREEPSKKTITIFGVTCKAF